MATSTFNQSTPNWLEPFEFMFFARQWGGSPLEQVMTNPTGMGVAVSGSDLDTAAGSLINGTITEVQFRSCHKCGVVLGGLHRTPVLHRL